MESVGPYRLESELGRGAMGTVFRGFDPGIGRAVAIRVVQIGQFANPNEIAAIKLRFADEAASGRLSHPGIVTVHHRGEEGDLQFLVMEFVDGSSLDKSLSSGQPYDRGMAVSVLSQVADALDYAHREGFVHGDLNPSNILVRPDGRAKITGFGTAGRSHPAAATTGSSGKSDQFSLAAIACQMLSGRSPSISGSGPETQLLHEIDRSFSPRTSEVLGKGLAKDPNRRFATCAEFVSGLSASLEERMPAAEPVPGPVPAPRPVPTYGARPPAWQAPASGGSRAWMVVLLGLLAIGVGSYMFLSGLHSNSGAPTSAADLSNLGLRVQPSGSDLVVTWSLDSLSGSKPKTGNLQIVDGGIRQNYALDHAQLSAGLGVVYSPRTDDVVIDMQVFDDRGQSLATGGVHSLHQPGKL